MAQGMLSVYYPDTQLEGPEDQPRPRSRSGAHWKAVSREPRAGGTAAYPCSHPSLHFWLLPGLESAKLLRAECVHDQSSSLMLPWVWPPAEVMGAERSHPLPRAWAGSISVCCVLFHFCPSTCLHFSRAAVLETQPCLLLFLLHSYTVRFSLWWCKPFGSKLFYQLRKCPPCGCASICFTDSHHEIFHSWLALL